jgi:hypothetical protein
MNIVILSETKNGANGMSDMNGVAASESNEFNL